ncbi:hypothetical protein FCU94_04730 [Vibrio sp. JPW-9-11-11]|uniref:PKD domain-containing protein n=1 Tax=Vibrio sp. JPW-9-11-11 TaxID=1416532 RepID=UPI0015946B04|nr:hypothetical protein [Vibrio sp. JPW-9-11-11]NVD06215.1 hypothetical protein [Vibrio sp. JPW-9-11-11]
MSTFIQTLILVAVIAISGCDDDIGDAEKYTKPTVNAGSDKVYTLPQNKITLTGSAKTYPKNVYSIKETKWTQTAGPTALTILNADTLTATILNPTSTGSYVFKLYVKDSGGRTNTDSVNIVLTQSAEVAVARSSLSYNDDYNLMWNTVANDPARYPLIEDEWQALYQPYLLKADQITSDEQWQDLVLSMLSELNNDQLELDSLSIDVANTESNSDSVVWSQSNGIGTIHFNRLNTLTSQELSLKLATALKHLSSSQEIQLDFSQSGAFDDQAFLSLLTKLTPRRIRLCLAGSALESDCVLVAENNALSDVQFKVIGAEHSQSSRQFAQFIETINLGGDTFEFVPSLPLVSGLVLR